MGGTAAMRSVQWDPRTLARETGGTLETIFPQLVPAMVAYLNRAKICSWLEVPNVDESLISNSTLAKAMLFELACAIVESGSVDKPDWNSALALALSRQERFYDAKLVKSLSAEDKCAAYGVANNLQQMLGCISAKEGGAPIVFEPKVAGFNWLANARGDFAVGSVMIEVKCANRNFSSADYRQLLLYWLLSYIKHLDCGDPAWTKGILLNPRLGRAVLVEFSALVPLVSSKIDLLDVVMGFRSLIGDRSLNSVEY